MKDARKSDQSQAPGHFENQGPKEQAKPAAVPDLEERHQRTRDQAPTDTGSEDGIRQQTYEMWEREGQPASVTWVVDATFVGHDLNRGTSSFVKTVRATPRDPRENEAVREGLHAYDVDGPQLDSAGDPVKPAA